MFFQELENNNLLMSHTSAVSSFVSTCDLLIASLEKSESMESIDSIVYGSFVVVSDSMLQMINTFKTNMFKFYKGFKRSEMRYFYESNFFNCKTAYKAGFPNLIGVNATVPTGYSGKYIDGINAILSTYKAADLVTMAKNSLEFFRKVAVELTRNVPDSTLQELNNLEQVLSARAGLAAKSLKVQNAFFTEGQHNELKFSEAFGSTKEFGDASTTLLSMESYLQSVKPLYDQLTDLSNILRNIATIANQNKTEIPRDFAAKAGRCAKSLALLYDIYGLCSMRQSAMEHNQIFNIERVYKTVLQ